jgi:hypothetical protein
MLNKTDNLRPQNLTNSCDVKFSSLPETRNIIFSSLYEIKYPKTKIFETNSLTTKLNKREA